VERLGWDESPAQGATETQQPTEPVVLRFEAGDEQRAQGDRVFARDFLVVTNQRQAAELGVFLKGDQGSDEVPPQRARNRVSEPARQRDGYERERAADEP
jgi:hypothetical protein